MSNVKIVTDSAADITEEALKEYDVAAAPFSVTFDGETFLRENVNIRNDEFYKTLRKGDVFPKTSQPVIQDFADIFRRYASGGGQILCVTLSSGLSGSYQSAENAARQINEEFGKEIVFTVDSFSASSGEGALVIQAVRMRDEGFSAPQIREKLEAVKKTGFIYVTVDTLLYLQKGGRIGKASALAGGLLQIKPIIILKEGALHPHGKVRGRKNSLLELARLVTKDVGDKADDYEFFLTQADVIDEVHEFLKIAESDYGVKLTLPIFNVGVTIGSHIGHTAVGLGYVKKYTKV